MSFTIIKTSFSQVGKDKFNRENYKTAKLNREIEKFPFSDMVRLKELFLLISGFAFKSIDYVSVGIPLVRIGDLNEYTINYENMVNLPEEYYNEHKYENYRIRKNDILVSLTGDGNIKCIVIKDDKKILLNQRVAILRAKRNLNINFYYWLLNSNYVKKQFTYFSNGKSQLNISPFDLLNIFVPVIDNKVQDEFTKNIKPFEKQINDNILLLKNKSTIIDIILANHFKYNYDKFNALKKNIFHSSFSQYGNNVDARFSVKFHRPALLNRPNKKIKNCLIIPMITGQGIETTDYVESGNYVYVSMADISSWELDLTHIKYVSNDYAIRKLTKKIKGLKTPVSAEISVNDIVMMRSGEGGIGKVAIIKDEIKGIFSDFIIRMRFDESIINPEFAYFYFRSQYIQYLIEINKKGLGNNTNIFPNQVQEFPIPDISLSEQQQIIDMINTELNKQDIIRKQISEKKSEIEQILFNITKF